MKKMNKRILAMLLAIVTIVSLFPLTVFADPSAEDDIFAVRSSGTVVTSVELPQNDKVTLTADAATSYQWQILAGTTWVNISGATAASIDLSYAMVANLLSGNSASVRCKAVVEDAEEITEPVTVTVTDPTLETVETQVSAPVVLEPAEVTEGPVISEHVYTEAEIEALYNAAVAAQAAADEAYALASAEGATAEQIAAAEAAQAAADEAAMAYMVASGAMPMTLETSTDEEVLTYDILIEYRIGDKVVSTWSDVAEIGKEYKASVTSPTILGYKLKNASESVIELAYDNTQDDNVNIIVEYEADYVEFTVIHHQQYANSNGYVEVKREIKSGLTDSAVGAYLAYQGEDVNEANYNADFKGFISLHYLTDDQIKADGTTEVNIYYDRGYYLVKFELSGGYGVEPIYGRYGTAIGTVGVPARIGYSFMGWSTNAAHTDYSTDIADQLMPAIDPTMIIPAENTIYYASWRTDSYANVTLAFWGENADDKNYSFYGSEQISVEPGTVINYATNNGALVCSMEENHVHDETCNITCELTEHIHSKSAGCYSLTCGHTDEASHTETCYNKCVHVHDLQCFTSYSDWYNDYVELEPVGALDVSEIKEEYSLHVAKDEDSASYSMDAIEETNDVGIYYFEVSYNYWYTIVYVEGSWYRGHGWDDVATIVCAHEHTDDCIKSDLSCSIPSHLHTTDCGLTCGSVTGHIHSSACYLRGEAMSENLWHLNVQKASDVTVAADGSSIINIYYDRNEFTLTFKASDATALHEVDENGNLVKNANGYYISIDTTYGTISKKWGASIADEYKKIAESAYDAFYEVSLGSVATNARNYTENEYKYGIYNWTLNQNGCDPYTSHFDIMPSQSMVYYGYNDEYDMSTSYYVFQKLDGSYPNLIAVEPTDNLEDVYFEYSDLDSEYVKTYIAEGLGYISEEDILDFEGFTFDNVIPYYSNYYHAAQFIYSRNRYDLVLNNGETNQFVFSSNSDQYATRTGEGVLYQDSLASYAQYESQMTQPSYLEPSAYVFDGFYTVRKEVGDTDATGKVDLANTTMPADAVILYAKWKPINRTVNVYLDSSLDATELLDTQSVPHRSFAETPVDPTNGALHFVGWFYMDGAVEKAFDFNNMPIVKDMNVYAKWSSQVPVDYTVRYVYEDADGVETEIGAQSTVYVMDGSTRLLEAKTGSELYNGYRDYYYPTVSSEIITADATASDAERVYTFYYEYKNSIDYTVRYLYVDTGENVFDPVTKTITDGSQTVTETYIPMQYYLPDAYQKELILSSDPAHNVITFWYTRDDTHAPVQIIYYLQNTDDNNYSVYQSRPDLFGLIGDPFTAEQIDILGAEFVSAKIDGVDATVVDGKLVVNELPETGAKFEFYYDRNVYDYMFKFLEQGTNAELATTVSGTARYGAVINQAAEKVAGYYTSTDTQSITVQIEDLEDGAEPVKNLRIFYYLQNDVEFIYVPVGGGTVDPTNEVIVAGQTAVGSTAMADANYKFIGWFEDEDCTKQITDSNWISGDKITPQKVNGKYASATYYAKFELNQVKVEYKVWDEKGGTVSAAEEMVTIGADAEGSTATADNGYTFIGWYNNDGCTGTPISTDAKYAPTNVTGAAIYYARFEKLIKIEYVVADNKGGKVQLNDTTAPGASVSEQVAELSGTAVGATAIADPGFYFVGWFDNEDGNGEALSTDASYVPAKVNDKNVQDTYYAKFAPNTLTITKNGGSENERYILSVLKSDGSVLTKVVVAGNGGTKTITNIPVGDYTIVEDTNWSWRYSEVSTKVKVEEGSNAAAITNGTRNNQWLSGVDFARNIFETK